MTSHKHRKLLGISELVPGCQSCHPLIGYSGFPRQPNFSYEKIFQPISFVFQKAAMKPDRQWEATAFFSREISNLAA
jgi:hypothetical protein